MKHLMCLYVCLALLGALLFGSCTIYYFDKPQPIDINNTYKLPNKYTGSWYIKDSLNEASSNWDSISIAKSYYHYITRETYKGALSEFETDTSVLIVDNKMYVKENGTLTAEYAFESDGDSMIVYIEDSDLVEFGSNAFLRQIDYGYILNTRHEHLDDWWELKFIDLRNEDRLIVRGIGDDDIQYLPPHKSLHNDLSEYLIASCSAEEIKAFVDNGGFSNILLTLAYSQRLKN